MNKYIENIPKKGNVIVLGAGERKKEKLPSGLIPVSDEKTVLDWLYDAYAQLDYKDFFYVSGYKAGLFDTQSSVISFRNNPSWGSSGPLGSLFTLTPKELDFSGDTYISYSDIIYRKNIVEQLVDVTSDVCLVIDSKWKVRYESRTRSDRSKAEKALVKSGKVTAVGSNFDDKEETVEFIGLMKLSPGALKSVYQLFEAGSINEQQGLLDLIKSLMSMNYRVDYVDVSGDWSELNASQDLARFVLGTKAESLERLRPLLAKGLIEDQVMFTFKDWSVNRQALLDKIQKVFYRKSLIIRSSSLSEDSWTESAAGVHESILNVPSWKIEDLGKSIDDVFDSYRDLKNKDQVLIQKMIENVRMSGVVMTRTPSTGSPYYVLNIDDKSKRTDSITSGNAEMIRTIFVLKGEYKNFPIQSDVKQLLEAIEEVESLVKHDSLDIEFVTSDESRPHIVQVRPIAIHNEVEISDILVKKALNHAVDRFESYRLRQPFLAGERTYFSVMSDWNPAEIIGTKPGRLAFSLYRYLVTDEQWARQRMEAGYRDVRPNNLIVNFLGHPYIDLRVCFNSLTPAGLKFELADKLVNFYLDKIKDKPELHDKVEFDVIFNCTHFNLKEDLNQVVREGFLSCDEARALEYELLKITQKAIADNDKHCERIALFDQRFKEIRASHHGHLDKTYRLLEDVRNDGVNIFSHLARNAFIAVAMLKSMLEKEILSKEAYDSFLASLETVSGEMNNDANRVRDHEIDWEDFMSRYGHLRPGTYDITSPCYHNMDKEFVNSLRSSLPEEKVTTCDLFTEEIIKKVEKEIDDYGLGVTFDELLKFIKTSIEGREFSKYIFTKNLSYGLEEIALFGKKYGFEREDMSCLLIEELFGFRTNIFCDIEERLSSLIRKGREEQALTQSINLPNQIYENSDFFIVEHTKSLPNFITSKKVIGSVMVLSAQSSPNLELEGKVIVIPNADPGFDWVFSKKILGLVTMYGGSNSHMAIRSAEFQIPAVIGAGEVLYEKITLSERIELDCGAKKINFLEN